MKTQASPSSRVFDQYRREGLALVQPGQEILEAGSRIDPHSA